MTSAQKVTQLVKLARKLSAPGSTSEAYQLLCSALLREAGANLMRCTVKFKEVKARPLAKGKSR